MAYVESTLYNNNYWFDSIDDQVILEACVGVLRINYPGDDWEKIQDIVIRVSDRKFKDCIQSTRDFTSDQIDKALGLAKYNHPKNGLDPIYWAAYVLED